MEEPINSMRVGRRARTSRKRLGLIVGGTMLLLALVLIPLPSEPSKSSVVAKPAGAHRNLKERDAEQSLGREFQAPRRKNIPPKTRIQHLQELSEHTFVSSEELAGYLDSYQRNAASLLAAFSLTGETNLLREAMEKYPNDPRVAYTAWFRAKTPEQRLDWLEKLKAADPANSLPNYLLANELLQSGHTDAALAELESAWTKSSLTDYAGESIQDRLEAYSSIGLNAVEATGLAWSQHPLPHLAKLKELGRAIEDLGAGYAQANDMESAIAARQMVAQLSDRLRSGPQFLITELVGMAIEMHMLNHLDPATTVDQSGLTAAQRVAEITRQREAVKQHGRIAEQALNAASDADVLSYFSRVQVVGETAAMTWLSTKYDVVDPGPRPDE